MATSNPSGRGAFAPADAADPQLPALSNLWQLPLLLVSLGLFTLATYMFVDPRPGPTLQRQVEFVERAIEADRFDAAIGQINALLSSRLEPHEQGPLHLLMAEALDRQAQRNRRADTPQNHRRIIAETRLAYERGVVPTPRSADRLARSYEALGRPSEASANWRVAIDQLEREGRTAAALPMRRSMVEMLIDHGQTTVAAEALQSLLGVHGIDDEERAWALGELARMRIDADRPAEAMTLLAEALALSPDEQIKGQVNYRLGYAAWRLGDLDGAHGYLALARRQLGTGHYLDAEACLLLGQIAQSRQEVEEAARLYEVVLRDHPGSRAAPRAQLGRALCRLVSGDAEGGVWDLGFLAEEIRRKPALVSLTPEVLEALQRGSRILAGRGDFQRALELLAQEQSLAEDLEADFFARLGLYLERLADQTAGLAEAADDLDRPDLEKRTRALRTRAGDAYLAYCRRLTLADDHGYGEALWKAVSLYEEAANMSEKIAALEVFVAERPADPIAPEALFRLGRAYQAVGRADRARESFISLRGRYPQSLAAAEAAVPLAQAYIAQGETQYPVAEGVLRSVVDDNPALSPESQTFRLAVWELGHLYYRMGRYGEALARLEEFGSRYSDDPRLPQLTFLKADCYRQAASAAREPSAEAELASAEEDDERATNLRLARQLFDRTIELYDRTPPATQLDRTYERLAHFYRADCLYDLGEFEEAITLYDAAAYRYQDDPSALAAYVQIVNAYARMGRFEDARVANERAKWLLRRIPPQAFTDGRFTLSRDYWEQWLKWTGESGLW